MEVRKTLAGGAWSAGSFTVGLILGLGVRSLFHEPPGHPSADGAPAKAAHHAEPGHASHGHEPAAPAARPEPGEAK